VTQFRRAGASRGAGRLRFGLGAALLAVLMRADGICTKAAEAGADLVG
jgi:Na+/H+-translocating membrane pyrophosphatase